MVRHIFLTVILTLSANAADIYDTNSGRYRSSVDIVKQTPNAGVLVNPDVSAIATIDVGNNKTFTVPLKYWKAITVGTQADGYAGSSIVEMSAAEKAAVDAVIATAAAKRRGRATARNAARPKRSEITAIKAANAAATTVADLRVINDTLIQMMENVLHYQRVNIDEDE